MSRHMCVVVCMKLRLPLSDPLWNLQKFLLYCACYISVHLYLPPGLSCTPDQYLNLHTVEKETTDWNSISLRAVMSNYLSIWVGPNASAQLNWAQRKGREEIGGVEVNETGTLQAGMKSCIVLTSAINAHFLTSRFFQWSLFDRFLVSILTLSKAGMFLKRAY